MSKLRDLLNIKTEEDLAASAGPVDGNQVTYQLACYDDDGDQSQQDGCCLAFITPADVSCLTFEVWGGGGAGAGMNSCCAEGICAFGPSGSAGAYVVKCLNATDDGITSGDRFDMIVGSETSCACNWTGCRGCYSCVCGSGITLCAEGGQGGLMQDSWGTNTCCTGTASAFGGDINIDGLPGKYCATCVNPPCYSYNQFFIPYPGGLTNLCGGWIQIQQLECTGCSICNYCVSCKAVENLVGVGSHLKCYGYVPGIPGASGTHYCECECIYPCRCGPGGTPGMIRITYK